MYTCNIHGLNVGAFDAVSGPMFYSLLVICKYTQKRDNDVNSNLSVRLNLAVNAFVIIRNCEHEKLLSSFSFKYITVVAEVVATYILSNVISTGL